MLQLNSDHSPLFLPSVFKRVYKNVNLCFAGEFFWQEECNKCPPGKSTVRQINNEYSDCIDTR